MSVCLVAPGSSVLTDRFLRTFSDVADHVSYEVFVLVPEERRDGSAWKNADLPVVEYGRRTSLNKAINSFFRQAAGRYLSLWDHASIAGEGCLPRLVGFLDDVPEAGVVGPKMRDGTGRIQQVARTVPSFFSLLRTGGLPGGCMPGWGEYASGEADWYAGPGMTISRYLIDDIGPVPHSLRLYWSIDLCLRARRAGWHVHYLHDAQVAGSLGGWYKAMTSGSSSFFLRFCEAVLVKFRA